MMIAAMMIQVQLSSKMWHRQLLFIICPPKLFYEAVIGIGPRTGPLTTYYATAKKWLLIKIKDDVAVLYHKPATKEPSLP